jgi:type IV pilus assembly protein PilA
MRNNFKRQDGFTLVELMVVVAIIGLLSTVAIPNFKSFTAKARVTEAKLQLASIYTAETSFYSDYDMYAHCLRYMAFDPDAERASRYYMVGFFNHTSYNATAYSAAVNSGLNPLDCPQDGQFRNGTGNNLPSATFFEAGKGIGSRRANASDDDEGCLELTGVGTQADSDNMIFLAGAYGVISTCTYGATCSCLTINERKIIKIHSKGY